MDNLKVKQEELDKKKYYSSLTARTDMSGKMEWCKGCLFRNDRHECDIPHEVRKDYRVCERQHFNLKEKESESRNIKKENVGTKPRTTRKTNNG